MKRQMSMSDFLSSKNKKAINVDNSKSCERTDVQQPDHDSSARGHGSDESETDDTIGRCIFCLEIKLYSFNFQIIIFIILLNCKLTIQTRARSRGGISEETWRVERLERVGRVVCIRHVDDYPQACRLAEIGLCLPVSTASCERGFSLQNRIKVKSRTSLLPDNLERLMKLASGPEMQSFPLGEAVTHWHSSRRRRLARLYQPSKRHTKQNNLADEGGEPDEECICEEELAECDLAE